MIRRKTPESKGGPDRRKRWLVTPFGWCMLTLGLGALLLPRRVFGPEDPRPIVGIAFLVLFLIEAILLKSRDAAVSGTATIAPILIVGRDDPIDIQAYGVVSGVLRVRHFSVATVDPDGHATLHWSPKRRGIFRLRDVRLCVGGPFGLLERTKELAPNGHGVVCVGPSRLAVDAIALSAWSAISGRSDDEPEELNGIRLYTPGDDVRAIHWRLSAREGRPMITTTVSPIAATKIAVDLGPIEGPKAEYWAQVAATFLDRELQKGPVALVVRDSQGVALIDITSPSDVSASLAAAVPGEPVPIDDVTAYVGAWRNDLVESQRKGVVVVSDDRYQPGTDQLTSTESVANSHV
jgi:uncharacterized protein (DUF58 family)